MKENYWIIVFKDGTHIVSRSESRFEYEENEDWLVSIKLESVLNDVLYKNWNKK